MIKISILFLLTTTIIITISLKTIKTQTFSALSQSNQNPTNPEPMKVHPLSVLDGSHKKLRRLPHTFNRVLELPFRSDTDVSVEESSDCFRFVAEADSNDTNVGEFRAQVLEIYPGVVKIVVRRNGFIGFPSLDDLELDLWRFRLPRSVRSDLASAVFVDGELIVTIPKSEEEEDEDESGEVLGGFGDNGSSNSNSNARIVLVQ